MIQDAIDSFVDIFSPPFRRVMWKSLALTLAVLLVVGYGLDRLALSFVATHAGWLAALISVMVGIGLLVGLALLAAPTTSLVASFFLDEIAGLVEREMDPTGPPGKPAPALEALTFSLRFALLSAVVTVISLILLFVPGFGLVAWIAANAYLLGNDISSSQRCAFIPWRRRARCAVASPGRCTLPASSSPSLLRFRSSTCSRRCLQRRS